MKNEQIKFIYGLLSAVIASATFYFFAENKSSGLSIPIDNFELILVAVTASLALSSLFLTKRLERTRIKMQQIFIIYSHKDKAEARDLVKYLSERGYKPWLDENEIIPGQNWNKAIEKAIENSTVALFLASSNTVEQKGTVKKEVSAAREVLRAHGEIHSPIIPILLEETILPPELENIHAVKIYEDDGHMQLERGLEFLLTNDI